MKEYIFDLYFRVKYFLSTLKNLCKWNKLLYDIYMNEPDEFKIIYRTDLAAFKMVERRLLAEYKYFESVGLVFGNTYQNIRNLKIAKKLLDEIISEDYITENINFNNFSRFTKIEDIEHRENLQSYLRELKVKNLYNKIRSEQLDFLWI